MRLSSRGQAFNWFESGGEREGREIEKILGRQSKGRQLQARFAGSGKQFSSLLFYILYAYCVTYRRYIILYHAKNEFRQVLY